MVKKNRERKKKIINDFFFLHSMRGDCDAIVNVSVSSSRSEANWNSRKNSDLRRLKKVLWSHKTKREVKLPVGIWYEIFKDFISIHMQIWDIFLDTYQKLFKI